MKNKVISYEDRELISNVFIKAGDSSFGKIDVQDPRLDGISILEVDGLPEDKYMAFEMQKASVLQTENFKLHFYTPNNISILHYLFKDNFKKYSLTLKNHVLKNDLGNQYCEYDDSLVHRMTMASKMVYEMIQFAETSIIFGYSTVEAFANYSIPDDYQYKTTNNKGIVETYDRKAIERNLSLSNKLKWIIAPLYGIDDLQNKTFWSDFIQLENLRNSIIHSKAEEKTLFHALFDEKTLRNLGSVDNLLDFFAGSESAKDIFPMFDCNGKLKIRKEKIHAKDVKNMKVFTANNLDEEISLNDLLRRY